jgi:hypothetical protein
MALTIVFPVPDAKLLPIPEPIESVYDDETITVTDELEIAISRTMDDPTLEPVPSYGDPLPIPEPTTDVPETLHVTFDSEIVIIPTLEIP